jgi:hypothetical protein
MDYNIELSLLSCHRVKTMANQLHDGMDGKQYRHIREYDNAILKWNSGSSAYIQMDGVFFQRMYVSLVACKQSFLVGCRPMICVDAYFMKGRWSGHLHVAIARDGNDDIYPLAYAICEAENRDTRTLFFGLLLDDIGYSREHMWSFMYDR